VPNVFKQLKTRLDLTSPFSSGTILEYWVSQVTELSLVIGSKLSGPNHLSQSLQYNTKLENGSSDNQTEQELELDWNNYFKSDHIILSEKTVNALVRCSVDTTLRTKLFKGESENFEHLIAPLPQFPCFCSIINFYYVKIWSIGTIGDRTTLQSASGIKSQDAE
jgi:hypothetical protein